MKARHLNPTMTHLRAKVTIRGATILIVACGLTSGCLPFVTIRDFSDITLENNARLMTLEQGMTIQEVLERMGPSGDTRVPNPFKSELHSTAEDTLTALFFYTGTGYVSDIPDNDLTPVVFRNDSLEGWGWTHWKSVATTYNLNIRRR